MSDDTDLVGQVRSGSEAAFAVLVERYKTPIYNLTYRMLGDRGEAEDAAQETFLRAYTRLGSYDARRPFKTWLFSIASHHCIDRLRKRRLTWLSLDDPLAPHPALAGSEPGPEQTAIRREQSATIQRLLAKLPPKDRLMIILRYWYDYSYDEIAEATGATVSAVKSRLHRARVALAEAVVHNDSPAHSAILVEG